MKMNAQRRDPFRANGDKDSLLIINSMSVATSDRISCFAIMGCPSMKHSSDYPMVGVGARSDNPDPYLIVYIAFRPLASRTTVS